MITLEPFEGKATKEQIDNMLHGYLEELTLLNKHINNLTNFTKDIRYKLTTIPDCNNYTNQIKQLETTNAAAQHIGYIESKIMESVGTIDKIALELATQIDRSKENDIETSTV